MRNYLTLAGLALIWGTSYILIKWGLEVFTPLQVASMRVGISAIALAPMAYTHLRRVSRAQLPLLLLVGLTGTALPSFLFPFAQTELSSSLTGMLSGLTPLCTFLVAWILFRSRPANRQFVGILLGLIGAIGLAWAAPGAAGRTTQFAYAGLILLACCCYGTSSNLVERHFKEMSSLTITVCSFFLVGLPGLLWAMTLGGVPRTVMNAGAPGWWALGYLSVLALGSTVLASIIFFRLVQRSGAVFASTVSYLIPVIALGWGLWDGEGVSAWQLPAVAAVLVGVGLSKRK